MCVIIVRLTKNERIFLALHTENFIDGYKSRVITGFMLKVKRFNEKHRKVAKVVTFLSLFVIMILSVLFGIAGGLCRILGITGKNWKRRLGILLAALLLIVAVLVMGLNYRNIKQDKNVGKTQGENTEAVENVEVLDTMEPQNVSESNASKETMAADSSQTVAEPDEAKAAEEVKSKEESSTASESLQEQEMAQEESEPSDKPIAPKKDWDTSDVDLESFMEKYPEAVGWIYFEDGHISYPVMQSSDNEKYRWVSYTGEEANTGAIFLDYRSAADFSDSNSIIYGHYMKDRTMFGTLRDYREDPGYYNDHQYFQVITRDSKCRYQIFEYMDVPETYVLYDYVGKAAYEFVKDAEPVRRKSYMDSEIIVNETKKVVTLSTCTDKDELRFVVLGVMVDEVENY